MNDEFARLRAEMDQNREGMRELGGNLAAFFSAMVDEGMTRLEATAVVCAYMTGLASGRPQAEDES